MSKICLIRQPAGLGDIFFCQKIAHINAEICDEVVWPVKPEFLYVKDYLYRFPGRRITYCSVEDDFPYKEIYNTKNEIIKTGELKYLPLHGHSLLDDSVMKSKYKLVNISWPNWKSYFIFKRNYPKENELFYDVLRLKDDTEYIFKNPWYASPPDIMHKEFQLSHDHNLREIELTIRDGFTVFDWLKVIENAQAIITAETCFNYLIEVTPVKAKEIVMLSKWNPPDFHHIEGLFEKPWKYIK
jgi:hypothetical protein